jgi:hypothetical protein
LPIEYPVEVALGACDFISQDVNGANSAMYAYYRLLNCGFKPGWAAGSDYPCLGTIGGMVTYVQVTNGLTYRKWVDGIKAGRTVISRNGRKEFLDLKVNTNSTPGDTINLPVNGGAVQVSVTWSAIENQSGSLEIVKNGEVVASLSGSVALNAPTNLTVNVSFTNSGWIAARRMSAGEHKSHTAAVFVKVNNAPIRTSLADAMFYVNWMDELLTRTSVGGVWANYFITNRAQAQSRYSAARAVFLQIASEASSPVVATTNLPAGVPNLPYSATLFGTNGVAPYQWMLLSGSLPGGLSLATNTGYITGTPQSNGLFNFTVRLTDSSAPAKTADRGLSISISNGFPPVSLWDNAGTPDTITDGDTNSTELGAKFRSFMAGRVLGVRFYRGPLNNGPHVGHLWSSNGTQLAAVTFTNVSGTGWQEQMFTTPVPIQSNTTYIISYYAPNGRYSDTTAFFNGKSYTNYPIWSPQNGLYGPNGVYKYGPSGFPTNTYNSTYYWVDVVFQPDSPPVAEDLAVSLPEDGVTNFAVHGSSVLGPVTYSLLSAPTNGVLIGFDTNSGAVTYQPNADYFGPDAFRYRVSDGSLLATGLVSLTVSPVNDAPVFNVNPTNRLVAEGALVTVTNAATDVDNTSAQLVYSLLSPPLNAIISTNGVITWMPNESQGPSTNTLVTTVSDGSLTVTNSFQVIVQEVNQAPAFVGVPPNISVPEGILLLVTNAASDADVPANPLTFQLLAPPAGALISAAGVISWTPDESQGPSTNTLTARVSDGQFSVTNSFQVIVQEVNQPPSFVGIPAPVAVPEGNLLSVTNSATDADVPTNLLTYQLLLAPSGAGVSPSGVITWNPGELDGPSTNTFKTRVSDGAASVTNEFVVTVSEVNQPPTFVGTPGNLVLRPQAVMAVTNAATDADWPLNLLSYQLINPPANASVNGAGAISWQPSLAQSPSTNWFYTVANDGLATVTNSFMVSVLAPLTAPLISGFELSGADAIVTWTAVSGYDYTLEFTDDLSGTNWQTSVPPVTASSATVTVTNVNPGSGPARFFRVRSGP